MRDLDNHWLNTDADEEDEEDEEAEGAEEKWLLKYDFKQGEHSFTTFRSLDS